MDCIITNTCLRAILTARKDGNIIYQFNRTGNIYMKLEEAINFIKALQQDLANKELNTFVEAIDALLAATEITDEMVERSAIAIFKRALFQKNVTRLYWEESTDDAKEWYRNNARAVLTAALQGN